MKLRFHASVPKGDELSQKPALAEFSYFFPSCERQRQEGVTYVEVLALLSLSIEWGSGQVSCCWSLLIRCEILSVYKACAMPFTGGKSGNWLKFKDARERERDM